MADPVLLVVGTVDVVATTVEVEVDSVDVVDGSAELSAHPTARATMAMRANRLTTSIVPDVPNHPSTVMVPVICGWIWQK